MSGDSAERSGPSLGLVLGGVALLAVIGGVVSYWRYTVSERHFAEILPEIDKIGQTVDTEGCVTAILDWHATCEANKPLCDEQVPRVMTHCLVGQDRTEFCSSLDLTSAKAQWAFRSCVDRGTPCKSRKKCACVDAYRTIDSFCRHDQQGVAL